jgi:hypothetical protein
VALMRIFKSFVLHRAASGSAPKRIHAELGMVGEFVIEPIIRESAIAGYSKSMRPVLRREPLYQGRNKERQGVPQRHLFGPISVPASGGHSQ